MSQLWGEYIETFDISAALGVKKLHIQYMQIALIFLSLNG